MKKLHRLKEKRGFLFEGDRKRIHTKWCDHRVHLHGLRREEYRLRGKMDNAEGLASNG